VNDIDSPLSVDILIEIGNGYFGKEDWRKAAVRSSILQFLLSSSSSSSSSMNTFLLICTALGMLQ
jgi:hypothetical protein